MVGNREESVCVFEKKVVHGETVVWFRKWLDLVGQSVNDSKNFCQERSTNAKVCDAEVRPL